MAAKRSLVPFLYYFSALQICKKKKKKKDCRPIVQQTALKLEEK
jgi:hypothetical protein